MGRRIPKSKVIIFEKSSHFPFIEEREKFITVARDFLMSDAVEAVVGGAGGGS